MVQCFVIFVTSFLGKMLGWVSAVSQYLVICLIDAHLSHVVLKCMSMWLM